MSLGSQRAGSSALQLRLGVYSRACRHRRLGLLPAESLFVDGLLFGAANLLLGLAPVVEFRAGLIAVLEVEFVGALHRIRSGALWSDRLQ